MAKNIRVIDPCYEEITKMYEEVKRDKKKRGIVSKTTYSQIICNLIKSFKKQDATS
ncbi:MAG: hypothetical protein OIN86_13050 [Candidatus Methanoperedens sp.]|nr:hypothetical protein [Candidatus Methanoperedens sp.]CAG0948896.1 hypothetical protein METP1_00065 [Methanosarcinales archaeon]